MNERNFVKAERPLLEMGRRKLDTADVALSSHDDKEYDDHDDGRNHRKPAFDRTIAFIHLLRYADGWGG